jgi:hypothetical protein
MASPKKVLAMCTRLSQKAVFSAISLSETTVFASSIILANLFCATDGDEHTALYLLIRPSSRRHSH